MFTPQSERLIATKIANSPTSLFYGGTMLFKIFCDVTCTTRTVFLKVKQSYCRVKG